MVVKFRREVYRDVLEKIEKSDTIVIDTNVLFPIIVSEKAKDKELVVTDRVVSELCKLTKGRKCTLEELKQVYELVKKENVKILSSSEETDPIYREVRKLCRDLNLSSTDIDLITTAVWIAENTDKRVAVFSEDSGVRACILRFRMLKPSLEKKLITIYPAPTY